MERGLSHHSQAREATGCEPKSSVFTTILHLLPLSQHHPPPKEIHGGAAAAPELVGPAARPVDAFCTALPSPVFCLPPSWCRGGPGSGHGKVGLTGSRREWDAGLHPARDRRGLGVRLASFAGFSPFNSFIVITLKMPLYIE